MRSAHRPLSGALSAIVLFMMAAPPAVEAQGSDIVVIDSLAPTAGAPTGRERITLLETHLLSLPDDYRLRWRAAQEYAQVGLAEPDSETRSRLLSRGYEHATAAKKLDPSGLEGRYWLAVAASLIADVSGGRTKVRMGDESYRESAWVLQVDSMHAGAHYLQGRIHASVMRLNPVTRFIARLLVGGEALGNASWAKAEMHLRRAADLEPELAMHHFELAMAYQSMEMPDQMRTALVGAVEASQTTPFQEAYKERARELLGAGR